MRGTLVGREAELGVAARFLDLVRTGPAALVIGGEQGIGKSALWGWTVRAAADRGMQVLSARPAQAEAQLAFAGLADLLETVADDVLSALREPQRSALAVALLREEPGRRGVDRRAVCAATVSALRRIGTDRAVLVAVDDVQWLDRPTSAVLEFAARRLGSLHVGVLACERVDGSKASATLDFVLPPDRVTRLTLGPLSLAALHDIVKADLGRPLPRRVITRIERTARGNPFYALELARALGDGASGGDAIPLSDSLRAIVAVRITDLPRSVQAALLAVAASAAPTVESIAAATGSSPAACRRALDAAVAAGLIALEAGRVRFVHPLYAAGVYDAAPESSRQRIHRRLAAIAEEPEQRARHLALATTAPDPDLAVTLDEAAESARARGAVDAAAELLESARRLTPSDRTADRQRRAVRTAELHFHAGELARARTVLDEVLGQAPSRELRAEALRVQAEIHYHQWSMPAAIAVFERALEDATDPQLRCSIELHLAFAANAAADFVGAEPHARRALALAEEIGDGPAAAEALAVSVILDYLLGRGLDEPRLERALAMEDEQRQTTVEMRPTLIAAHLMLYEGRLARSRELFLALRRRVLDRGEDSDLPFLCSDLAWAACEQGDLAAAAGYADEALDSAERTGMDTWRCCALAFAALVAAWSGDEAACRSRAELSLALVPTTGFGIAAIWARWALALLDLVRGDAWAAVDVLDPLTAVVEAEGGIDEPIRCAFLADHIEALVAAGERERASRLTEMLDRAGRRHRRGWVQHRAARCRALLLAAGGDLDAAADVLNEALRTGGELEHRLDYARTLLVSAQVERRARRRAQARRRVEAALAVFDGAGARLWSERSREELARTAARPGGSALTETERRVAELAAAGHTNRQVANALFISPKTVEANLVRVYRKLGIHSRAELGSRIGAWGNTR